MPRPVLKSLHQFSWFGWSLVALFLLALAMRFWGLERFNTLVFDEVYFAKYGSQFLRGEQGFGGHPPLTTYLFAGAIWLAQQTKWGTEGLQNGLTGMMLTPISYRWLNALVGSFIPVLVAAIAFQLSHRRSYALLAGGFLALDGLFLVESRYTLTNVHLVTLGLLGHLGLLLALNRWNQSSRTGALQWPLHLCLLLSGIGFGGAIAVKWNGLWYLFGLYLTWICAWLIRWINRWRGGLISDTPEHRQQSPLNQLTRLNLGHMAVYFTAIPFLVYYLAWIPYIRLDPSVNFWQWQARIWDYHHRVGGVHAHPYCSRWFSWLVMARPIAYLYKPAHDRLEPVPIVGPPLPHQDAGILYDVHAMGNPILWWCATTAVVLLTVVVILRVRHWAIAPLSSTTPVFNGYTWTALYLSLNWFANWLPWIDVDRCVFLYHYMESYGFALLAIALLVDRWLSSSDLNQRWMGIAIVVLVAIAFLFWMPLYYGLPLTPWDLQIRRWFPSWI